MIVGVAFCPHPPVLVPEVAQGAAAELDNLRAACRAALQRATAEAARVVVVGSADTTVHHEQSARGSLAGFGVPLELPLGRDGPGSVELPLSLTIGAWLLREIFGPDNGATGWSVGPQGFATDELDGDDPVALLVMGDGSARRSTAAPGYFDPRAEAYDRAIADALRSGRSAGLRRDPEGLLVAGARAWAAVAPLLEGTGWDADLLHEDAPYGVGYFVAAWTPRA